MCRQSAYFRRSSRLSCGPQPLSEDEVALISALAMSRLAHAHEEFVRATTDPRRLPPRSMPLFLARPPNSQPRKEDIAKNIMYKI